MFDHRSSRMILDTRYNHSPPPSMINLKKILVQLLGSSLCVNSTFDMADLQRQLKERFHFRNIKNLGNVLVQTVIENCGNSGRYLYNVSRRCYASFNIGTGVVCTGAIALLAAGRRPRANII
mmetsp:Transcript_9164/g.13753  ORF Transcript_9164/g.13753 Transcript_9164/m.13753 type:complete len:122 (-) Transcript_9164:206-571(-)